MPWGHILVHRNDASYWWIFQSIQKAPDTEEVAGFSEVLREFYEVVYEVDNEEPPVILRTFKKKTNVVEHPEGKVNGHGSLKETEGKRKKKANKAVNGNGQSAGSEKENVGNTVLPNGLHMEDGPQPLFIVDVKQLKKDRDIDNDSGIHNGDWKGIVPAVTYQLFMISLI